MIETAARLFRRDGYHATSWRQLVDAAGTPWGSAHHHFPGGKEQLGVAAVEVGAAEMAAHIDAGFAARNPADAVRALCRMHAEELERSDFAEGCPIATVALETATASPAVAAACRQAFDDWQRRMADGFVRWGVARKRAAELATFLLAAVEGALLVARVSRSGAPLVLVGDQLGTLLRAEIDASAGDRRPGRAARGRPRSEP
jgi:TetR/AcrR family transcriptional repressor of lmrAB and yxaGH operons